MWSALVVGALLAAAPAASSDETVEILSLNYRTAEDVLPAVVPLVEGHGAITGSGTQLFVRASPGVIAQVKEVVASLDTRPRSLWIAVRQVYERRRARPLTRYEGYEGGIQSVRALEGRPSEIAITRDLPVRQRQAVVTLGGVAVVDDVWYESLGGGFAVVPRLFQGRFSVDIVTHHATDVGPTRADQELRTSVEGNLGEWIEIGHVLEEHSRRWSGVLRRARRDDTMEHNVLLKVELVGD
jgi:hypothetical protein